MYKKKKSKPTKDKPKNHKASKKKGILQLIVYSFSLILVLLSVYNFIFSNRVLPGVHVKGQNVSFLTKQELTKKVISLEPKQDSLEVVLDGDSNKYYIKVEKLDLEYNTSQTVEKAFNTGRGGLFSHFYYLRGFFVPLDDYNLEYSINQDKLNLELANLSSQNFPYNENARFEYIEGELTVKEADSGYNVKLPQLKADILDGLKIGTTKYIAQAEKFTPSIFGSDLEQIKPDVLGYLESGVVLRNGRFTYNIPTEELISFVSLEKDDELKIIPNIENITAYAKSLEDQVNVSPKALVFEVVGSDINFEPPVTGIALDTEKSAILIEDNFNNYFSQSEDYSNSIDLIVTKSNPSVDSNEYGITELIAEGESYFRGSIRSRVSNIETATNKIKGILVAPGEEFSFNEAVGPIDVENGFNEAYIISKGRTVLGTGGGVCQVSTTVFRAALNSGLPITERSAHAYRVGYYEQNSSVGLDATIYQPSLDLKFKNDTQNHVLVYANIDTSNSYMNVKIYGTKDGRNVVVTEPKMITEIAPPEPIYEDTGDLPAGSVEQTEWPAWGGTVEYSRVVKDASGNVMYEDTFKNYYTPWPAVFRRGV